KLCPEAATTRRSVITMRRRKLRVTGIKTFLTSDCELDRDLTYKRHDLVGQRVRQPDGCDETDHAEYGEPRGAEGLAQGVVVRHLDVHDDQDTKPHNRRKVDRLHVRLL